MSDFDIGWHDVPQECKGRFFRYSKNSFVSSYGSVEIRESYRLLKRRSCLGCSKCQQFDEDLACAGIDGLIEFPKRPEDGKVYELKFVPGVADWDGVIDDWSWRMEKTDG